MTSPYNQPDYAELHCLSNFSFLRGASSAKELFERAKALGYRALAITDEASMAGIVRAFEAAKASGVALIVGSELFVLQGPKLVLLAETLTGYPRPSRVARMASGCAQPFRNVPGWRWNCIAALMTRRGYRNSNAWARVCDFPSSPAAMSICMHAAVAPCRTRSPRFATGPRSLPLAIACSPTARGTCASETY